MPQLNESTSKIGEDTKKEFLNNIRSKKPSNLRGRSEPRIKPKNGQSIVEKMLYEGSNISNTPTILTKKPYGRGIAAKKISKHSRVSESVPALKKQPILDIER